METTGKISGFVIFHYNLKGHEAGVPLESRNASAYIVAFGHTKGMATGVAINAVSSQAVKRAGRDSRRYRRANRNRFDSTLG